MTLMTESKLEGYFFAALFVGVLVTICVLLYPFLDVLALSIVLATLSMPLYDRLLTVVRFPGIAACIVVVATTLAVVVPATGVFFLLLNDVQGVTQYVAGTGGENMPKIFADLHARAIELFPILASFDPQAILLSVTQTLGGYMASILTNTATAFFKIFITLIAMYYFLRDGHSFIRHVIELSPLSEGEDVQIMSKLNTVMHSLVRGQLVVACLQGLLTGLGLLLAGVPNPVLLGSIAGIASLIPSIGTGMVNIPAVLYLVFTGQYLTALLLGVWAFFVVGVVDNVIGPKLIGGYTRIHPLFMLLAVLGGIAFFGMGGILIGPLVFGLFVALSEIYKVKVAGLHT